MKRFIFLLSFLLAPGAAFGDACIFSGSYVKCLASGGIWIDQGKELRLGTGTANANYVGMKGSGTGSYTLTFPTGLPGSSSVLTTDTSGTLTWTAPGGTGDVVGPSSATDTAIAKFNGTTGKLIQNSGVTISSTNQISAPGGTNSEKFGSGVVASGASNAVFGKSSSSTGDNNTIVGYNSKIASGAGNVLIGDGLDFSGATTLAAQLTAIGSGMSVGSVTQANGTTLIGNGITAGAANIGLTTAIGAGITIGPGVTAIGRGVNASGTGSTGVGTSAVSSGLNSAAFASSSTASGSNATAIGESSTASGTNTTAVGESSTASVQFSTALGQGSSAAANSATALGMYASAGFLGALAIDGVCTATQQMVVGGSINGNNDISSVFIGNGVTNAAPLDVTYNATGGSGANVAGAVMNIAGGRGTGTGVGGDIVFKASPAGTTGSSLNALQEVGRFGTAGLRLPGSSSGSTTVAASAAASGTLTLPAATDTLVGKATTDTLTNKTISGASNTITNVSLTTGVTGVLPLANGGTNKNMTPANGGIVWTDADSMEVTSAGTAQNWVLSGGAGTPTMSNTTTTGKFVDGSADEIQMRIQAHSTQTSNIVSVEKSDATSLLAVTNVNGTNIRGTTTNDDAAAGFVGEYKVDTDTSLFDQATPSSNTYYDVTGISLTLGAGDWDVFFYVAVEMDMTNASAQGVAFASLRSGSSTLVQEVSACLVNGSVSAQLCYGNGSGYARVSLSGNTTYKMSLRVLTVGGSPAFNHVYARNDQTTGYIQARRVR